MGVPDALVSVTAVGLRCGVNTGSNGNSERDEPVSIRNEYCLSPMWTLIVSGNPTVARETDCPPSFPAGHDS